MVIFPKEQSVFLFLGFLKTFPPHQRTVVLKPDVRPDRLATQLTTFRTSIKSLIGIQFAVSPLFRPMIHIRKSSMPDKQRTEAIQRYIFEVNYFKRLLFIGKTQ